MRTEPLTIGGLAGPSVVSTNGLSGRYRITVGGHPASRIGRSRYALAVADGGMVEARVRGGFLDAYPSLEINGATHRTGPPTPLALRALALSPIGLLLLGGLLGGLVGGLGAATNFAVARSRVPTAVKALLMLVVLAAVVVTWAILATAIQQTLAAPSAG
ncbi:MAG TPA: hypothetical protein VGJ63_22210 [Micromonosporaceae bacterium]